MEIIDNIFSIARKYPEVEKENIILAKKMAMKHNIKLQKKKNEYCKYCNTFFKPENVRIRINNHKVTYTCLNCNKITRFNYRTKPHLNNFKEKDSLKK